MLPNIPDFTHLIFKQLSHPLNDLREVGVVILVDELQRIFLTIEELPFWWLTTRSRACQA